MARPAGSKNKLGAQAKENIVAVFTRLGGTAAMAKWAGENLTEFYRMYARLAPSEADVSVTVTDERSLSDAELAAIAAGRSAGTTETAELPQELHGVH